MAAVPGLSLGEINEAVAPSLVSVEGALRADIAGGANAPMTVEQLTQFQYDCSMMNIVGQIDSSCMKDYSDLLKSIVQKSS